MLRTAGTRKEQRLAARILPFLLARSQHQLLVSLLLVNALAVETLPLVFNLLVPPLAAVVRACLGCRALLREREGRAGAKLIKPVLCPSLR